MKAAVLHKPNDLRVEDRDIPPFGSNEMLLRVKACALCGTDTRIYKGTKTKGVHYPSVIGHEISGTVEACGSGVQGFEVGDPVAICPVIPCGVCYACQRGMDNICLNRTAIGYEYDGGFQEYMRIPGAAIRRGNIFKAPPGLSFETLSLIEPLACCYNGNRRSRIKPGDTVVIMGAGPIGLMHLQLARLAGATTIIVTEPQEERRLLASDMGADRCLNPQEDDLAEVVMKETQGLGVDATLMAIGVPELVNDALKITRKQGSVNLFAGFGGKGESTFEANLVHYNEIHVTGTASAGRRHFHDALRLLVSGQVELEKLITHRFALEDIDKALETVLQGAGLKVIVQP
jgi:L-iditol 2-dehydrogenase